MSANPKLRRAARLAAVQALYQMDVSGDPSQNVIRQFLNHRFGHAEEANMVEVDEEFFENIVTGVVKFQDDIDKHIIENLSEKWSLKRLDKTLRALLRCGSYEVLRRPDIPALVVIDEYVSVSSEFFAEKEAAFINGALDKIAKNIRAAEFGVTAGNG